VRNLQLVPSCGGSRFLGIRVAKQRRLNSAPFGRNASVLIREIYLPKVCSLKASASGKYARTFPPELATSSRAEHETARAGSSFFFPCEDAAGRRGEGQRQRPERIRRRDKTAGKRREDLRRFSFAYLFSVSLGPLARSSFKARLGRRFRCVPKGWTEEHLMLMKCETYLRRCSRMRVNSPRVGNSDSNSEMRRSLNDYFDHCVATASTRCDVESDNALSTCRVENFHE